MRTTRIFRIFRRSEPYALLALALLVPGLQAQSGQASLTGVIRDPGHEAVPAIPVQLKNTATGITYTAVTSDSGSYMLAGLPAGAYELSVPAVGFTLDRFEKKDLVLRAEETLRLDVEMPWAGNLGTPGDDPSIYLRAKYARTNGPVPRMRDGKPDLSGLWNGNDDLNPQDPEALPAAAALASQRRENKDIESPSVFCLPSSTPPLGPLLWKIVQTPTLLVLLFEDLPGYRQIYLDGRPHPKDLNPTWMGHSVGHWEGDTLVVDSVGYNDKSWLGDYSHTEQLHVIERYTRRDLAHLDVRIIMEDPGTFVKPWIVNATWNLAPSEEMMEYVCTENNRDVPHLVGK
jgi:Carboxypeptidase regulatory-like domain